MKKVKSKKSLIALAVIAIVGVIGGTFAFYTSTASFANIFKTKPYSTEFTEEFTSPDDWTPGTTTSKKVFAKNTGDVPVAVRVSYTEKWVNANGTEIENVQGDKSAAIINFATDNTDWIKNGNYYYYNKKLAKDETSSSFIESVTFNPEIEAAVSCTTEGNKKTCTSTGDGYDGATYTLTVNIETIQFDAVEEAWGLDPTV